MSMTQGEVVVVYFAPAFVVVVAAGGEGIFAGFPGELVRFAAYFVAAVVTYAVEGRKSAEVVMNHRHRVGSN